jgi:hypothetical protein
LWQFRKYSVLSTYGRNRQSDGYYQAKCARQELLQDLHKEKLSIGELYRDATGVGFCDATSEVIRTHPFEVLSTFLRRIAESDLLTTESNRGG